MRVLYLNPFTQEVSGPDESLLTLLRKLVPMGIEPHVVLPRPGPKVAAYQALGARVHFQPLTVLKRRMSPTHVATLLPRLSAAAVAIASLARREQIELIHTNMEVVLDGALVSRFIRVPHVLHYRGNTLDRPRLVFDALTRLWTSTAERVFCISNATAEIFRKRGLGQKVEVLYNAVDVAAFKGAERSEVIRGELGAKAEDILIGTVGRIHARKDMATFLRAAAVVSARVPRARWVVVGAAEAPEELAYERELHELSRGLGIEERLCWAGARRDMPAVLKALDLFVLSSRHEGFGRVVAEALAAELPMVVSDEGAFPELVPSSEYGLRAKAGDASDFAEQIQIALQGREEASRVGRRAGERALQFDAGALASRVADTYRELCAPRA